jgi:integrase
VLLKDSDKKGLRLRITKAGGKHWQFETRIKGKLFTRALGEWPAVSIVEAKEQAHALRGLAAKGQDPRELERQQAAIVARDKKAEQVRQAKERAEQLLHTVAGATVWAEYCEDRRQYWGDRHYQDHLKLVQTGGKITNRGTKGRGVTIAGPLHDLLDQPLAQLTAANVDAWASKQAKERPTAARLALRCLKAFLNWGGEQPQYAVILAGSNPAKSKKARESLGKAGVKQDALMREQLPAWFSAVRNLSNPAVAAYLQIVLLTGARPGEVLAMRWEDMNTRWKGLTIRDKVEGERVIPLTPYVSQLLTGLPKRNEWVFASTRTVSMDAKNEKRRARYHATRVQQAPESEVDEASDSGVISIPRSPHVCACQVAGIDALTLHGLRRSFKSLTEWLDIPAGVVAQIMGHKPSATAEKHYTVRPLDLLRVHHERIEAWILEQGRVPFTASAERGKLSVVV